MMLDGTDSAERRDPDRDGHVDVAVGAHAVLRQVADDLVERRVGEPVELDLRNRDEAAHRQPDRDADDRRLRQRRIETPPVAEGFGQPLGHPEDSAELGDVLAEDQDPVVGGHRVVQRPVDRLRHRQGGGVGTGVKQRRFVRVVAVSGRPLDDLGHVTPPSPTRPSAGRAGLAASGVMSS